MRWKQYSHNANRWLSVTGLAFVMAACTQMCSAQQLSIVTVRAELEKKMVTIRGTKLSFADALAQVSKQTGRSVIADDEPHLQSADLDVHGSAKQAIDRIADVFDYTWTVSKHGVILLTKRFKTPLEYPQVNLPELKSATQDAFIAIKAIPYNTEITNTGNWFDRVYQEFTPEQKVLLKTGVAQAASILSQHQVQLVNEATLNIYFASTIGLWRTLSTQIERMPHSFFQMRDYPEFYVRRGDYPYPPQEGLTLGRELDYIAIIDGKENVLGLNWLPRKPAKVEKTTQEKAEVKSSGK